MSTQQSMREGESDASEPPPREPTGNLKMPEDTKGHYVVLWAPVPPGKTARAAFVEVDVIAANSPDHAKRLATGAVTVPGYQAPFAPFLRARAAERDGILLRAVPAMHWPRDPAEPHGVKATTYRTPEPVFTVG